MDYFEKPKLFVVFPMGGSGTFLATMLEKLIDNNLRENILIAPSGHAHHNWTGFDDDWIISGLIDNGLDDIEDIKKQILEKTNTENLIIQTHNYKKLLEYKRIFPAAKFLIVTIDRLEEELITYSNHIIKWWLSDDKPWAFYIEEYKYYLDEFKQTLHSILEYEIGEETAKLVIDKFIFENRDEEMRNFYLWFLIKHNHVGQNLLARLDSEQPYSEGEFALKFDPADITHPYYEHFELYFDYITPLVNYHPNNFFNLPYSTIRFNNSDALIKTIESLLSTSLTDDQRHFVESNLTTYYDKQPKHLFDDFPLYLRNLEAGALKTLDKLKNNQHK